MTAINPVRIRTPTYSISRDSGDYYTHFRFKTQNTSRVSCFTVWDTEDAVQ